MKKTLSDQEIDKLLSKLTADAAVDESMIDDISASPATWWAVKRNIAQQTRVRAPWPPVSIWRRFLLFGVPSFAAVAVGFGIFAFFFASHSPEVADLNVVGGVPQAATPARSVTMTENPNNRSTVPDDPLRENKAASIAVKTAGKVGGRRPQRVTTTTISVAKKETIATEFIALSHAGGPESGQIVRVKVPSSMMVSLGVIQSVAKPERLVNAEVVLGDDGQTHAIRFIR